MSRKLLTVALTVPAAIALAAAPASAAGTPRLVGHWKVAEVVTAQQNSTSHVGQKATARFNFVPQCASGGCLTKSMRTRVSDGVVVTTRLTPSGNTYVGSTRYLGSCFLHSGGVVKKAYTYTEKTSITVTRVNGANTATKFTGKLKLYFKPTPVGTANKCSAGYIFLNLASSVRTS